MHTAKQPVLGRLGQEAHEFKTTLGYTLTLQSTQNFFSSQSQFYKMKNKHLFHTALFG